MCSSDLVFLICLALAVVWTGVLSWTPFERALRWYASTASGLILKPFSALWSRTRWAAPNQAAAQNGSDDPGASDGLDGLGGIDGHAELDASDDRAGSGGRAGEASHSGAHDLAHPAPFEHYPLPGSHEVPQNAAYGSTQEVPAGSAQPTAQGTPQPETRNAAKHSATPHLGERSDRYRRLPVYLSTPPDDEDR